MSFSRTHFSLISIIFTFQSPLSALQTIITQDSERLLFLFDNWTKKNFHQLSDKKYTHTATQNQFTINATVTQPIE